MTTLRRRGRCRVLYCFDVSRAVDLARAAATLRAARRTEFHHKGAFPAGGVVAAPLRVSWAAPEHAPEGPWPAGAQRAPSVEVAVYDFGAVAVTWTLEFDATLADLVGLASALYEHAGLIDASRAVVDEFVAALGDAAERPKRLDLVEDYFVFELASVQEGVEAFLRDHRDLLARVLRAEPGALSEQEIASAMSSAASYGRDDVALVDWLGAILVGQETQDERLLLELATIELLELRVLDSQLDPEVEAAYAVFSRPRRFLTGFGMRRKELERLARAQADDAILHEGIDNALKLFGDSYLARLYRVSASRFRFDDYDATIQRKLTVLERIYERLSDQASRRRAEILEWIIILLIAADMVIVLMPKG